MGGNHLDTETYQSRALFECKRGVTLHSIPHTTNLLEIELSKSNQIWSGALDFIEQEQSNNAYMEGFEQTKNDNFIIRPFLKLRSKLEFKNSEHKLWGEAWFNPIVTDLNLFSGTTTDIDIQRVIKINPEGTDTVQQLSDTTYKVIVQLPNSGFHPFYNDDTPIDVSFVALGMKFNSSRSAAQFEYVLNIYQTKFRHEQQQYYYDRMVYAVNIMNFKTIILEQDKEDEDNEDTISDEYDNKEDDVRELTKEFSKGNITPKLVQSILHDNSDQDEDDDENNDDDFGEFISA